MSDSLAGLNRKIESASDLQSVVRTMKAVAAANISQYENSVVALKDYERVVELGLGACLRKSRYFQDSGEEKDEASSKNPPVQAVIFGSDQGLVGQFDDIVVEFAIKKLKERSDNLEIWAIGERAQNRITDLGMKFNGVFDAPVSIEAVAYSVGQILLSIGQKRKEEIGELHLFFNQRGAGPTYTPVGVRLLPLDQTWMNRVRQSGWPNQKSTDIVSGVATTMRTLIREYLFSSIYRACVESLASENASRLAAMQRAEKNIDELLQTLNADYHRLRQGRIDEEIFDVVSGYDAISRSNQKF